MKRSEARPVRTGDAIRAEVDKAAQEASEAPLPASLGGPGSGRAIVPHTAQIAPGAVRIPHDPVNEQILLAAGSLADPERRREILRDSRPEHFFGKNHAAYWATLAELDARGLDFALDTMVQLSGGKLDPLYFATILERHARVPPNLRHHAEILRWDAARIEAAEPLADVIALFRDQSTEPAVLAAACRRLAEDVSHAAPMNGTFDSTSLIAANRAAYEARGLGVPVWPYGIEGFEREPGGAWRVKPGMKPGKVTVVTALSGHGKSIFVKAVALGQVGLERPGLFGAFEDEAPEVLEDVAAMSLGLDRDEVDEGRLQPEDKARFFEEQERVASFLKFMRHPPTDGKRVKSTIAARIEWCFNEAVRVGAVYVVVDLLARLFASAKPEEEQQGWECFQRCAKDTGIHGVATHQQRAGDVEQRSDKRPTREGLKGSKGVLEVADTLIGVYRASLCESVEDKTLEAIVLKQRRGRWPFAVRFDFDPKRWTLKRGREVAYLRPGEDGLDGIVDRRGGRSRG